MTNQPIATASVRVPVRITMKWEDVREAAEAAGVPNSAGMRIIVDRVANPTPLDRGNDPVIEFTWELARREYPE